MEKRVQRSMLILPAHVQRFVEKAYLRGADAIVLDLEDAVPLSEKDAARKLIRDAAVQAGSGGADVFVRVNNEPSLLFEDLDAAVFREVHGIFVPKIEAADQVAELDAAISKLERERGIEAGKIRLAVHIESPLGLLSIHQIAQAGTRTESMSLGVDDYCLQLGVEPSEEGTEMLFPMIMMVTVCKAAGISPLGVLGTVAGFRDLDGFRKAAERGRKLGCSGGYCIHPDQVAVLNEVFTPPQEKVDEARRIVEAFEEGLKAGRAAISLDDRMVDTPIYKRAKLLLEQSEAIAETERRKTAALASLNVK